LEEKRCTKCKLIKPLSEFNFKSKKRIKRHSHCKECRRAYVRGHYARNREIYIKRATEHKKKIKEIRKEKMDGCIICGYKRCMSSIDLHHLENKEFCISNAISNGMAINRLKKELKKCVPVCRNCHGEINEELIDIYDFLSEG